MILVTVSAIVALALSPSVSGLSIERQSGCAINLATVPTYQPHLVSSNKQLIQPVLDVSGARILYLATGQIFTIACEGTGNYLLATGTQFVNGSCVSGTQIQVGSTVYNYVDLGCKSQPKETVKTTGTCGPSSRGTKIEVGWQVVNDFINQITVCHDKTTANTYFAVDTIRGTNVDADDQSNTRPSFRKGNFFTGIDVDGAYSQSGQNVTVANIVGSVSLAMQYIDVSKSYYFARGHLSPDADFIDSPSQDATYYYFNAAPQFQSFNNGNWKALEIATRNLAASRDKDYVTYTGTFGNLTLADVNGQQKQIFLAFDTTNKGLIPVPKYYWKVVHDPVSNTASAFVGINNPHIGSVSNSDIFCPDVCGQIPWVTWERTKISSGYMFCCTAANLQAAVSYAPNLGTLPLLV